MPRYRIGDYHPHQNQKLFHKASQDPSINEVLVTSSIRSGKTHGLIYDALISAWNNKTPHPILVAAPTYQLLGEIIITPLKALAQNLNLFQSYAGQGKYRLELKNGNVILFRSTDKETSLYGLTLSKAFVDEAAFCSEESIQVIKDRMLTTKGKLVMTTTPAGTASWMYDKYIENVVNGCEYITYNITDNPVVTPEAINLLRSNMSLLRAQQQLEGKWVNQFEDLVYYSFDNENVEQAPASALNNNIVYVGLDYNLDKNAWVAVSKTPTTIHVIKEGYGAHTTQDMGRQILQAFPNRQIVCIPDATGANRIQGIGVPNENLLKQLGLNVIASRQNPKRVLRYDTVNSFLLNALGNRRLKIDPSCQRLIKELQQLTFQQGTDRPDSKGEKVGHITDALGYALVYLGKSMRI